VEGLVFTIAVIVAIVVAVFGNRRRHQRKQGPVQTTEPPGERSAPDDWPRDGGDNPRTP
jgi:hypothetical protein